MDKVYIVLIVKDGFLKIVAEYAHISDCNEYLSDKRYRVIDAWKKCNE